MRALCLKAGLALLAIFLISFFIFSFTRRVTDDEKNEMVGFHDFYIFKNQKIYWFLPLTLLRGLRRTQTPS